MSNKPIAVIGAGSWGTALALVLARNQFDVRLWDIDSSLIESMQQQGENARYLPGVPLLPNITLCKQFSELMQSVDTVLVVVPSHAFQATMHSLQAYQAQLRGVIWASKGLEPKSCRLLHTIYQETFANLPYAVLSGPSFAKEVAANLPTAVTLACQQAEFMQAVQALFHASTFRLYHTQDIIGVQLGGAVKNVLAVAAGISDGVGYAINARAALITRGLAEMRHLGEALGAESETLMGLSGLGDLVLTCSDDQSRNRRFGLALGQGKTVEQAKQAVNQTIEGINTAAQVYQVAQQHKVEMPICSQVYRIIYQDLAVSQAITELLSAGPQAEHA
jgi:glycerol-3-phosphate dehydrogenase (NAD(P)+)